MTRRRRPWNADRDTRNIRFLFIGIATLIVLAFLAAVLLGKAEDIPTNFLWLPVTLFGGTVAAGFSNPKGASDDSDTRPREDDDDPVIERIRAHWEEIRRDE